MTCLRRAGLALVLCALVVAQALGLMHGVLHGLPAQAGAATSAASAPDASADRATWATDLFAGHADDSTCPLFDPLTPQGAPAVPRVVLPVVLASVFIDCFQGEFLARWAALFDARGPPSPR